MTDPIPATLRALVAAAPRAMAIREADGTLLAANPGYHVRRASAAAAGRPPGHDEHLAPFSPDGLSHFTLVTFHDSPDTHPAARLLTGIAHTLPVILNLKDRDSRYLLMNRHQARLYGTTPEDAVGKTAADLLGADYGRYTRRIDAEVMASGKASGFYEETYPLADGSMRRWLTCKVPVGGADHTVWGVTTVSIDITDRVRLEDGLRQAKEEAEAASRAKSGFLAAMSHELRTPLNAVIGFAEILHQQSLGPIGTADYVDYAGHILSSGQHLLTLINDVLDFARIESGSMTLSIRPLDLGALLRGSLDSMARGATTAGVTLRKELAEHPITIRADAQRLRQVMLNVAGNAVKFTPRGGSVTVTLQPDMRGGAIITVADSGVGISEANLQHVFEPFWQADSGLDRLREGAGIGLPLARQLVTLHGGRLELNSRVGEGTKVTIHLPEHRDSPV